MTPRTAAIVENVEFLLAAHEHPERICTRLNVNAIALSNLLRRGGRGDLAAAFENLRSRERKARAVRAIARVKAASPVTTPAEPAAPTVHDWLADADAALGDWRAKADAALSWGGAA